MHSFRYQVATGLAIILIALPASASAEQGTASGQAAASVLITEGEQLLAAGDIHGAIEVLSDAVASDPTSTLAITRLGGAYMLGQQHQQAISAFQQAIALDPANAGAFIGLGMAYLHLERAGPAKAALTEAKRLDPTKAADIDSIIERMDQGGSQRSIAPHP